MVNKRHIRFRNEDDEDEEEYVEEQVKWYEKLPEDPKDFKPLPEGQVCTLKDEANAALQNDCIHYKNKCSTGYKKSENSWLQTALVKGTAHDKIAASVVLIQNSPIHNLAILKNLINMLKPGTKNCTKVMDVLTDLFINDLLLPGRKLKKFESRPLSLLEELCSGNLKTRQAYLTRWYFEDRLKTEYTFFIAALQSLSRDTVESNRHKAIAAMQKLLAANPEQETVLLANIVNKLGDPSRTVAAKGVHCLKELLREHPNMKEVVLDEIETLLFRSNISTRAQYYGICFLMQYVLSRKDEELSVKLIRLYFSFFKMCVKKGDVDSRMMKALLGGVNRAFPYAKGKLKEIENHIETMYKVVHIAQLNISISAMCLLYQVCDFKNEISDRFYTVLYKKILDPKLSVTTHQALFLNLIFRALKHDLQIARIKVFIKRLLQICHYVPVPLACGILLIVSKIIKIKKTILSVTKKSSFAELEDDDEGEHYVDVKEEDEDATQQEEEEEKRIASGESDLMVNGDKKKSKGDDNDNDDDSDDDENDSDDDENDSDDDDMKKSESSDEEKPEIVDDKKKPEILEDEKKPVKLLQYNWYHYNNFKSTPDIKTSQSYNGLNRNPLFAGGEQALYCELVTLSTHFHPTVALFASSILHAQDIDYSSDPLQDFTTVKFLDRFVFRNPKKIDDTDKGVSRLSRTWTHIPTGVKALKVHSEKYVSLPENKIPVDELFLYKYMQKRQVTKKVPKDDKDEISSVTSEEFETVIDRLMGGEDEIDFAEGIERLPTKAKKKKGKKKVDSESEEDSDAGLSGGSDGDYDDMDDDEEEEDVDEGEDDGLEEEAMKIDDDGDIDDDDEEMVFDDDDGEDDFTFTMSDVDNDEEEMLSKKKTKGKKMVQAKKKGKKSSDVFVSADEFAHMLEDTGDLHAKHRSLATLSNKDKAGVKQLKWEMDRDHWIRKDYHKKRKGGNFRAPPKKKVKKGRK